MRQSVTDVLVVLVSVVCVCVCVRPLNVSPSEKSELLVTFAALVLHDSKLPITSEAITKLVKAAGGEVEPYWPKLFGQYRWKHWQQIE